MFQGLRIPAFHSLQSDRRGAILPIAAVATLIMFMLMALAIDVSMIISAKNRIRRTMDATGIAIATHFRDQEPTETTVRNFAEKWIESNYPNYKIGEYFDLTVTWSDGVADIDTKVRVNTIFMHFFGANEIDADVTVRVISETRGLEVALALDNTGSMNGTEINYLRGAVWRFVDTLFGSATDPNSIQIGMVPFVSSVNIKDPNEFPTWIDAINPENILILDDNIDTSTPLVSYHGEIFNPQVSHAYLYKLFATVNGKSHWHDSWKGCVEARTLLGPNGEELDVTDTPPNSAYPETLFVPYFWPDEPDDGTTTIGGDKDNDPLLITSDSSLATTDSNGDWRVRNNFLGDQLATGLSFEDQISSILKYQNLTNSVNFDETGPITFGPSKSCPNHIVGLTSNQSYLQDLLLNQDYLDDWNESGSNIAQGIMWAWRVLSKNEPFTQGDDYLDAEGNVNKSVEKVIVVFFAGPNGIVWQPNPYYSDYSAYGYIYPDGRLDPAGDKDLDTKTLRTCENARAPAGNTSREKITIYAIGYAVTSSDPIVSLMQQCTGSADRVFLVADRSDLSAVFESLAKDLTKLRVVY